MENGVPEQSPAVAGGTGEADRSGPASPRSRSLPGIAPIPDPYREQAWADLIERIANGRPNDWFNMSTSELLGNRTPTEAWQAGDHQAVERMIDKWYADAEASAERHRNDPTFMAMLERRREELDAERAEADKRRRSA
jgi:hypothetical protein